MRQDAYDVEVVYQAKINHEFTAYVSRGEPIFRIATAAGTVPTGILRSKTKESMYYPDG